MTDDSNLEIMIETEGLSKYYGNFIAVNDLNFKIRKGEVVAFLGPNGAGKSTTMKMLTGYLSPSAGTAEVCGMEVASNRKEVANRIGYLPENGPLYEEMTPLALLNSSVTHAAWNFFEKAKDRTGSRAVRFEHGSEQAHWKAFPRVSSTGRNGQRSLLHEPEVLIMDEPTAGLDPNQVLEVRKTIKGLGKTILLSTHILQEVPQVADRIILIDQGRLVFDGTPDELKEEPSLDGWFNRKTMAAA